MKHVVITAIISLICLVEIRAQDSSVFIRDFRNRERHFFNEAKQFHCDRPALSSGYSFLVIFSVDSLGNAGDFEYEYVSQLAPPGELLFFLEQLIKKADGRWSKNSSKFSALVTYKRPDGDPLIESQAPVCVPR